MLNKTRGNIAFLTTTENSTDEELNIFCEKNQYVLNVFTRVESLITAVSSKKYTICLIDGDYPKVFQAVSNGKSIFNVIEKELMTPIVVLRSEAEDVRRYIDLMALKRVIDKPLDSGSQLAGFIAEVNVQSKPETGIFEQDYCGLFIDDFLHIKYFPFDIFCRLSETKTVKVIKAYDEINTPLIQKLKDKGVSRLFLKRDEYKRYLAINAFSQTKGETSKEKLKWVRGVTENVLHDVYVDEVNLDNFFAAKQVVETTLDLVVDNEIMFEFIKSLNEMGNDLYKEAIGVSVYSVLIASKMGMNDPKVKFRLSIAGLFSDLGMKHLPPELVDKSRMLYNYKEQQEYFRHTDLSVQLLKGIDGLPEEILQIISQHHENLDGSGFPRRITKNQIHPLSKIIRVADEFCFYVLRTKNNHNVLSPLQALEELKKPYNAGKFDSQAIAGLEELLLGKTRKNPLKNVA